MPDNIVVKHRRSIAMPSLAVFAGAAMIISDKFVNGANNDNLRSSLVLFGAAVIVVSATILLIRLFGDVGDPYLTSAHCRLKGEELFFDRAQMEEMLACIDRGDVDALLDMERSSAASVAVLMYRSPDGEFTACRPYEYVDLEYRPLRGIKIVERHGDATIEIRELEMPASTEPVGQIEPTGDADSADPAERIERVIAGEE